MSNPLLARRGAWLRQFGDTSERTIGNLITTLKTWGGFDLLCLKVADGLDWVGSYDAVTPVTSLVTLLNTANTLQAAGIAFAPVVVPRGFSNRGEAEFHAQIADACGSLIIDIEPGGGFWDQSPLSLVPSYFSALRAATAPTTYLCAQPDPRPGATQQIPLDGIAPHVDAFAAQHYIGFDAGWRDIDGERARVAAIKALGRDTYVTLWGLGDLARAGQFWQAVRADVLGFQVFALGAMNAAELAWAATLPDPAPAKPQPVAPTNNDFIAMARLMLADPPDLAGLIAYAGRFV